MSMRRSATLAMIVATLTCAATSSEAAARRVLLSIDTPLLKKGENFYAFHIDTFGVYVLAVCRVPMGWELKMQKYEGPEGYVSGEADFHPERLNTTSMYLVDVYDYQATTVRVPNGEIPASFSGWVKVRKS